MRTLILFMILLIAGCAGSPSDQPAAEETAVKSESIDDTLTRHAERLIAIDGIQGIYVGQTDEGEPCLVIMATVPAAQLATSVPDSLEGWPVRIESGDEIRPLD